MNANVDIKLRHWVDDLPKRGRITFSKDEVMKLFPAMSDQDIRTTLYRLGQKKKIQSVWHGFFVIVPADCGLSGIV
jgi:hypothetical protein